MSQKSKHVEEEHMRSKLNIIYTMVKLQDFYTRGDHNVEKLKK